MLWRCSSAAGGIGNTTDLHNSTSSGEEEIVAKEVFYEAITVGRTLDALAGGDEIEVGAKSTTDWLRLYVRPIIRPHHSLYGLGRLFGLLTRHG
jgi:hypothetical protein